MKIIKLLLTTIAVLLCSMKASAYDFAVGGIYYEITSSTDLTVRVTYRGSSSNQYSNEYSGALTIPENVTYNSNIYSVTSIKYNAFEDCSSLTSITIPKSVTRISDQAFNGCTSLKEINIEDGNTTLSLGYNEYENSNYSGIPGKGLFYDCPLEKVYLGRNLEYSIDKKHGYSPFYNKGKLISITIGDSVSSIGYKLFSYCSRLTNIIVEEGNEVYDSRNGCNAIIETNSNELIQGCSTTIIPESVTSIGYQAFVGCSSLTTITIPESVTKIGKEAFYSCNNLHSLTIGSGVLSIGDDAFSSPDKVIWLTNTPPSGYNYAKGSINYVSNDQYTKLSNVKIYPYLSSMFEVTGVKYVPASPSERTCHAIDCAYNSTAAIINVAETASFKGVAMKVMEVMPYTFYDNDHIKEVSVSHLGNIGNYAFYDCDSVQSVELSNEGNIGYQAFYNCDGVINVVASNKGYIGEQAFYNCDVTESVTISNQGVIGSQAFYDCNGIKNVDIRNQGSIYDQAFYGCNGMGTAIVANKGTVGSEVFFGCSSLKTVTLGDSIGSLGYKAFYQCSSLQKIAIPDSVKSVGEYCFSGCSTMKSAVIGDGLTNIAGRTFENCTSLVDVTVGDGVTTISNYAFTGCFALTNISLGRSVATINNYAFQNCSSLPEITLSQAVTTVGDYVFVGCRKLADVIISDRTTALSLGSNGSSALFADCPLDSVYIGGKITYNTTSSKGYSPFYRNTSLRTVVITDREEQIYANEFYGCTNLQNVTIGNGVKSIGNYAFSGCSSLEGFAFGSNMESIGAEAFSDCTSLTSITSHAAVPPTCGTQALDDINKWNCSLRIPSGYATAYQTADQWKDFFFIEDVVEVTKYILTFMVDGKVYHTESLAHKAEVTIPDAPTKEGYTFSGWNNVPATMPAEDVTASGFFIINKYLVTFKIGDKVISSESMGYGSTIVVPETPERKGYTFDGWGEVAKTVPASDLTYEGSYSVNSYLLTYMVDGEIVQSDSIAYGTKLVTPKAPTKEGHTFSGWGKVPVTMPAEDVTVSGFFTINKYLVTFKIGEEVISSESMEYGSTIVVPEAPEREGYTFDGWGEVAETVPAGDVTYEGTYTVNVYKVYYYVGEELVHTAEMAYGESISEYVYEPTTEGDIFEGWVGENHEIMPAHDVVYIANITNGISLSTLKSQESVLIYDLQGRRVLDTENLKGMYIINGRKVVYN